MHKEMTNQSGRKGNDDQCFDELYAIGKDMTGRKVDTEIKLVKYYPNYAASLVWYQDPEVCKQVDNRGRKVRFMFGEFEEIRERL